VGKTRRKIIIYNYIRKILYFDGFMIQSKKIPDYGKPENLSEIPDRPVWKFVQEKGLQSQISSDSPVDPRRSPVSRQGLFIMTLIIINGRQRQNKKRKRPVTQHDRSIVG
jgi:hypothetical protein